MTDSILTLGLDVDGVLLDYLSGIYEYLNGIGIRPAIEPDEVDNFGLRTFLPGRSDEEIRQLISDFSVTEGFGRLPMYQGALEAVHSIKKTFGSDIRIVAITSAGTSEETRRLRQHNLRDLPLDELYLLPLGADKTTYFQKLGTKSVFIDDLHKNVLDAEKVGVRGILFRQLYNQNDSHDLNIQSWNDDDLDIILDALAEKQNTFRYELA